MPRRKRKSELHRYIEQVCELIRELLPKAQLKVHPHTVYHEGDDALIEVTLPTSKWSRTMDKAADSIAELTWRIEMEEGYTILVSFKPPLINEDAANKGKERPTAKKCTMVTTA